jgi:hypothetical protein
VRTRTRDNAITVRRRVDVGQAFAEETPTRPAVQDSVPLDAVPLLAVPRAQLPWDELGQLATEVLLRVDGVTPTMVLVTGLKGTPVQGARELAALVRRGIVRLTAYAEAREPDDAPAVEVAQVSCA